MHPTTKELLAEIKNGHENLGGVGLTLATFTRWKDAGYPDLTEPEHHGQDCWTCGRNENDNFCTHNDVSMWEPIRSWLRSNCALGCEVYDMPPRNGNHPPCPGWTPKEPA